MMAAMMAAQCEPAILQVRARWFGLLLVLSSVWRQPSAQAYSASYAISSVALPFQTALGLAGLRDFWWSISGAESTNSTKHTSTSSTFSAGVFFCVASFQG